MRKDPGLVFVARLGGETAQHAGEHLHGKEGVDGSSVRGLCKSPANQGSILRIDLHELQDAVGMEPFMELSGLREPRTGRTADAPSPAIS